MATTKKNYTTKVEIIRGTDLKKIQNAINQLENIVLVHPMFNGREYIYTVAYDVEVTG